MRNLKKDNDKRIYYLVLKIFQFLKVDKNHPIRYNRFTRNERKI